MIPGVVGALLDFEENLVAKSVSNSSGVLTVDFDTNASSDLILYLNTAQYKQKSISLNYLSDDGSSYSELVPIDLIFDIHLWEYEDPYQMGGYIPEYVVPSDNASFRAFFINNTSEIIDFDFEIISLSEFMSIDESGFYEILPSDGADITSHFDISSDAIAGMVLPFKVVFTSDEYEIQDYYGEWVVSSGYNEYNSDNPSPECNYGYKAYLF